MPINTTYAGARHEDCRDIMSSILPNQGKIPFLQEHLDQSVAVDDTTHKWGDEFLKTNMTTLQSTINNSVTTVPLATGTGAKLTTFDSNSEISCIVKVDNELMRLTANSGTDSVTVTRGYGGTTPATHNAGATIYIQRIAREGSRRAINDAQFGSKSYNFTQIFKYELGLSGTSQAVKSVGNDLKRANQLEKLLKKAMVDLDSTCLIGTRFAANNEEERGMGGLSFYATHITGSKTISKDFLEKDIIEVLLNNGADPDKLRILVPPNLYGKVMDLKDTKVNGGGMNNTEKTIVRNFDTYEYGDAPLNIKRCFNLPSGQICAYDTSKVKVAPLQGRAMKVEPLAKTGDLEEDQLIGEYTMEVMNGAECFLWFDVVS
jgi:Family of unknown function (DUF5309)